MRFPGVTIFLIIKQFYLFSYRGNHKPDHPLRQAPYISISAAISSGYIPCFSVGSPVRQCLSTQLPRIASCSSQTSAAIFPAFRPVRSPFRNFLPFRRYLQRCRPLFLLYNPKISLSIKTIYTAVPFQAIQIFTKNGELHRLQFAVSIIL